MPKTLIIKTGAAGDVVRTTTLFHILQGPITWIVDEKNQGLFPDDLPSFRCIPNTEADRKKIMSEEFDLVISLEENEDCARLASETKARKKIGVLFNNDKINYTEDSTGWFDMSLCSMKGRIEANRLKALNALPFQHWLFEMLGKKFNGEPYRVYRNSMLTQTPGLIGIEKRTSRTWPNKEWAGYDELSDQLKADGYHVKFFQQHERIRSYMDEIASCSGIICGDSLAMHISLAYGIPCIALFNCTSPTEIFDYGVLQKIVSPLLLKNFYSRTYSKEVTQSIPVSQVYGAFKQLQLGK